MVSEVPELCCREGCSAGCGEAFDRGLSVRSGPTEVSAVDVGDAADSEWDVDWVLLCKESSAWEVVAGVSLSLSICSWLLSGS